MLMAVISAARLFMHSYSTGFICNKEWSTPYDVRCVVRLLWVRAEYLKHAFEHIGLRLSRANLIQSL